MLDKLKTFLAVTAITVLVWLWSEGKIVEEFELVNEKVEFVGPTGEKYRFEPSNLAVNVVYRASHGAVGDLNDALAKARPLQIPIVLASHEDSDDVRVTFRDQLENLKIFKDNGVNILRTEPVSENVRVVKLQTVSVPVAVTWDSNVEMAEQPIAEPGEVQVTLPASEVFYLEANQVRAELPARVLDGAKENEPQKASAVVKLPGALAESATVEPVNVNVNFTVRKQAEEWTMTRALPIEVSAVPTLWDRYELEFKQNQKFLHDLKLEGPADVIQKIKDHELQVIATIRLKAEDLEEGLKKGVIYAQVYVNTPEQVQVISRLEPIEVKVTKREDVENGAGVTP